MELQQLKHFVAAVESKKLLTAAQVCEISQSGMSRSLGTLEETLGVRLLKRTAGGVEPTVYGELLLPSARSIVSQVERCSREMMAFKAASSKILRFGVSDNLSHFVVPVILRVMGTELSDMEIEIQTGNLSTLLDALRSGLIDCIFSLTSILNEDPDIIFSKIARHYSKLVARPGHPLTRGGREISLADLSKAQWATLDGGEPENDLTSFFLSRQLAPPSQIMKTNNVNVIMNSLLISDIIAFLPEDLITESALEQDLVLLDCEGPEIEIHTVMALKKNDVMYGDKIDAINYVKKFYVQQLRHQF